MQCSRWCGDRRPSVADFSQNGVQGGGGISARTQTPRALQATLLSAPVVPVPVPVPVPALVAEQGMFSDAGTVPEYLVRFGIL